MPLLIAPLNTELKVIKVSFGNDKLKKHLETLGLTINSTIQVLANEKGTLVVFIKGARFAIDNQTAAGISVIAK